MFYAKNFESLWYLIEDETFCQTNRITGLRNIWILQGTNLQEKGSPNLFDIRTNNGEY